MALKLLLLPLTLTSLISISSSSDHDNILSELRSLRSQSKSGVIHFNDQSIARFLLNSPAPRPCSFVLFFDVAHLRSTPELQLPLLRSEFGLVSSSFIANNIGSELECDKVFFCDLEFSESQRSFSLFGIDSVPHIRHVGAATQTLNDSEAMDPSQFAGLADAMSRFVDEIAQVSVGLIARPPLLSTMQSVILFIVFLIAAPFLIKRVLEGKTMLHNPKLWMGSPVFVYFFSVGGTMYNIIRQMPMYVQDRNDPGKVRYFYGGSGVQFGLEGFMIGFLYTMVGLILALVTHVLVRERRVGVQRGVMLVAMSVSYWAVKKVILLDNWKTGYPIHAFWPSNWE